jgi:SagB-type dehydrogenase family enzyme
MNNNWRKKSHQEATEQRLWELYHENSKVTSQDRGVSQEVVAQLMTEQWDHLAFEAYPRVALPSHGEGPMIPLGVAIRARRTPRTLMAHSMKLEDLSCLLFHACGATDQNEDGIFPRSFRASPSAGAMYPIDLFFHTLHVDDLPAGLYHYNPLRHDLATVAVGDRSRTIAAGMVQPDLAYKSVLVMFLVASFERTTQKYGERGYRFALIEAGHIGQNLALVAEGMGLGAVMLGGYIDHRIDEFLGLDGVSQSVVYAIAIGRPVSAGNPG